MFKGKGFGGQRRKKFDRGIVLVTKEAELWCIRMYLISLFIIIFIIYSE